MDVSPITQTYPVIFVAGWVERDRLKAEIRKSRPRPRRRKRRKR